MPGSTKTKLKRDIHTKRFLVALTPELHDKIRRVAKMNERTVQGQIRFCLELFISGWEKKHGTIDNSFTAPDSEK